MSEKKRTAGLLLHSSAICKLGNRYTHTHKNIYIFLKSWLSEQIKSFTFSFSFKFLLNLASSQTEPHFLLAGGCSFTSCSRFGPIRDSRSLVFSPHHCLLFMTVSCLHSGCPVFFRTHLQALRWRAPNFYCPIVCRH